VTCNASRDVVREPTNARLTMAGHINNGEWNMEKQLNLTGFATKKTLVAALKRAFPKQKFHVRRELMIDLFPRSTFLCDRIEYAIEWSTGPTRAQVRKVVGRSRGIMLTRN
jgi:hypothetical protein